MSNPQGSLAFEPRNTARGIIVHEGKILLMERWRPGMHYFSIPGGGIEEGETPEQTVVREILEETTVKVNVGNLVLVMKDGSIDHKIYFCHYLTGEPRLPEDAPEMLHMSEDNKFKPGWVSIEKLPNKEFTYWLPIKQALINGLQNGFSEQPVVITRTV